MINLSKKIDGNFESEETTTENIHEKPVINILNTENKISKDSINFTNNENNLIENNSVTSEIITSDNVEQDNSENTIESSENLDENNEVSNCLALTVKKDYNLSVVKNVFVRTVKGIWKVAISIFTLNIIKFFF